MKKIKFKPTRNIVIDDKWMTKGEEYTAYDVEIAEYIKRGWIVLSETDMDVVDMDTDEEAETVAEEEVTEEQVKEEKAKKTRQRKKV